MDIQEGCAEANLSTDEVKLTKNSSEEIYLLNLLKTLDERSKNGFEMLEVR